jgi:transposase
VLNWSRAILCKYNARDSWLCCLNEKSRSSSCFYTNEYFRTNRSTDEKDLEKYMIVITYWPPFSPHFNPTERVWLIMKNYL